MGCGWEEKENPFFEGKLKYLSKHEVFSNETIQNINPQTAGVVTFPECLISPAG